jgi:hypothetical protein
MNDPALQYMSRAGEDLIRMHDPSLYAAHLNIVEKVKKTIPASRGRTRRTEATKWLLKSLFIGQACSQFFRRLLP